MSDDGTTQERLRDATAALARIRQGELPTAAELAAAPRHEFWSVVTDGRFIGLAGVVTGHPNLHHGEYIRTSHLLWVPEDGTDARTASSREGRTVGNEGV